MRGFASARHCVANGQYLTIELSAEYQRSERRDCGPSIDFIEAAIESRTRNRRSFTLYFVPKDLKPSDEAL